MALHEPLAGGARRTGHSHPETAAPSPAARRTDHRIRRRSTPMPIQHINPDNLLKYDPLSQVVVTSGTRTVYIAGQTACDENFAVSAIGDYYAQSVQALRNLEIAVTAAGGTVEQIVSSTVYLKNLGPEVIEQFGRALATALDGKPFPRHAFTMIGIQALGSPDALVEIAAVAVLDDA
jgi:enamine deaminase RidA (YjgF/YER057c/UK114 family)